jgi:hypothetical protein
MMKHKLPFIAHTGVVGPLQSINEAIQQRSVATIGGLMGVGLTRLLEHIVLTSADRIALVRVVETHRRTFGQTHLASPITLMTFSRLWHVLQRLVRPHTPDNRLPDQAFTTPSTDKQYLRLYDSILNTLDNQRSPIAGLIFDNAHFLDQTTLKHLFALREETRVPFAMIFGVQMESHATAEEIMGKQLKMVPTLKQQRFTASMLNKMDITLFAGEILSQLLFDSNIEPDTVVEERNQAVSQALWARTQGNWHRLVVFMETLETLFSRDNNARRTLTYDIFEVLIKCMDQTQ